MCVSNLIVYALLVFLYNYFCKQGLKLGGHGHGKLTDPTINKVTTHYGKAIHDKVGDAKAMAKAVNATLLHASSTNKYPQHHFLPGR